MTVNDAIKKLYEKISASDRMAFLCAFFAGLLIHMPAMLMDVPNHDGLSSMYFSQNMITSGRWFLGVACAASSYFTVPWIIGLIGLLELSLTAVLLVRIFETDNPVIIMLISALLVSFPSLGSTFAYVFTLDGYMMGLFLSVLAVYLAKKDHFFFGGISLAFSLGIYQSYLAFAMLLSVYCIWDFMIRGEKGCIKKSMNFIYMGLGGAVLYYVLLMILLKIQGKVLDTYQGIDNLSGGGLSGRIQTIPGIYGNFVKFTLSKGFLTGPASETAALILGCCTLFAAAVLIINRSLVKKLWFWWVGLLTLILVPVSANVVLLITPQVNYHLIMRYQWVLFWMAAIKICDIYVTSSKGVSKQLVSWISFAAALVIVISYAVSVNIGYTNLQRKYEKTYAYAVRLLDRIENTEGYYHGIPVVIMGVIGDDEFPPADLTSSVTGDMIGLEGDYLLYSGYNYQTFFRHYLGADINVISMDVVPEIYYSDEYVSMESFPGETSVKYVDGKILVKTEDAVRD